MKPVNPYTSLLRKVKDFAVKVKYPFTKLLWVYPKDKMNLSWNLTDLYERTHAANTLGWDVVVVAFEGSLRVEYRKRVEVPFEFVS